MQQYSHRFPQLKASRDLSIFEHTRSQRKNDETAKALYFTHVTFLEEHALLELLERRRCVSLHFRSVQILEEEEVHEASGVLLAEANIVSALPHKLQDLKRLSDLVIQLRKPARFRILYWI